MEGLETRVRRHPIVDGTRLALSDIKLIDNILVYAMSSYQKVLVDTQSEQELIRFFADPMLEHVKRVLRFIEELSSCLDKVDVELKKLWIYVSYDFPPAQPESADETFGHLNQFIQSTPDPFTERIFHRLRMLDPENVTYMFAADEEGLVLVNTMPLFLRAYHTVHRSIMDALEKRQFTTNIPMILGFLLYCLGLLRNNLKQCKEDVHENGNKLTHLLMKAEPSDHEKVCGKLTHEHIKVIDEAITTVHQAAGPAYQIASSVESKSSHGVATYVNNYLQYSDSVVDIVDGLSSSLKRVSQDLKGTFRGTPGPSASSILSLRKTAEKKEAYKDPFSDDLVEKIVDLSRHSPPNVMDYRKPNRSWLHTYSFFKRAANDTSTEKKYSETEAPHYRRGHGNTNNHNENSSDCVSSKPFLELMYEYSFTRANFMKSRSDQAVAAAIAKDINQRSTDLTMYLDWCSDQITEDRKKITEQIVDVGVSKQTGDHSSQDSQSNRDADGDQANMRISKKMSGRFIRPFPGY